MKPISEIISLKSKVAIVTGGAKGIGQGIVNRLAEAGAKVVVADLDETAAETLAQTLSNQGHDVIAMRVDVSSEQDVQTMVNSCQQQFGSIDILVNNAGIFPQKPIAEMSEEEFEKVMHVNLRSCFLTTKYVSETMKVSKSGKIINITSIDALHPSMVGLAHYDASKHGMWGFTKNSALELSQYGISVNAIAPGGVATPGVQAMQSAAAPADAASAAKNAESFMAKIPMHRMGEPDEIGLVA